MLVPNRHKSVDSYRYGFNGKEKDDEIKSGEGNHYDYGFRIHDPRVGRFFSTDPLTSEYAFLTPYQFASNRPIDGIDIDGKEYGAATSTIGLSDGTFKVTTSLVLRLKVINESSIITAPEAIRAKAEAIKSHIESQNTLSLTYSDCGDGAVYNESVKTTVVLDYLPYDPLIDGAIQRLYLTDIHSVTTENTRPNGGKLIEKEWTAGYAEMRSATEDGFNVDSFKIFVGITLDNKEIPNSDIIETGNHEASHVAGLNHPWRLSAIEKGLFPKLDANSPSTRDNQSIIENRMNSGENTIKSLRPASGSTSVILDSQIRLMIDNIINSSSHNYDYLLDPICKDIYKPYNPNE